MTRAPLLFLAGALLLAASTAWAAPRAVWMWEPETYALLQDRNATYAAIAFLREHGIDRVYLYADAYRGRNLLTERPELYRALIRRLRRAGISTFALLGSWHLRTQEYVLPARHAEAVAMLRRVLDYNARASAHERFDGINLDIEPHMLDQWDADRPGLLRQFLELGQVLMRVKRESAGAVPMGPAIPFWLDGVSLEWNGVRKPVHEHVLDLYDYAAVMDYRNRADGNDGMVALVRDELDYAARVGKTVAVGVEVSPAEPAKVTFAPLDEADLERELAKVENAFAGHPAFSGFVLHHFQTYRDWVSRPPRTGPPR